MVTQSGMVTFKFGLGELCRPSSLQDITNRVAKAKQKHLAAPNISYIPNQSCRPR
jgi:hypothetical protein